MPAIDCYGVKKMIDEVSSLRGEIIIALKKLKVFGEPSNLAGARLLKKDMERLRSLIVEAKRLCLEINDADVFMRNVYKFIEISREEPEKYDMQMLLRARRLYKHSESMIYRYKKQGKDWVGILIIQEEIRDWISEVALRLNADMF